MTTTNNNILSTNFNAKSLIKYVFPTICMMVFMSTYTIIDGLFVSNLVGEDALSAVNIVMPILNLVMAIGLMFATGGTAVMGKLMGEGREKEARSFLSLLYLVALVIGGIIMAILLSFPDEIVRFLGKNDDLFQPSKNYLISLSLFTIGFILQMFVQSFFVLAGKPTLGFVFCLIGGITNIILDYIFISPNICNLGITGAGLATGIGNCVPALIGVFYFAFKRNGTLYFILPKFKGKMLIRSMFNGMSELVGQLSTAITTLLFNIILLEIADKAGVASISVILYIQMIQMAVYLGYAVGVAPVISYKYGAGDKKGLSNVMKISFIFIAIASIVTIALSLLLDDYAVMIFIKKSSDTFAMAKNGLRIFSVSYLSMGVNIMICSMFTSLSNGKVSAILSLARTLVFLVLSLITLPLLLDITGVWLAVPVAELLAFILSAVLYKKYKLKYGY